MGMYELLKGTGGEFNRKVNVLYAIQGVKGVGLGLWAIQGVVNTLNSLLANDQYEQMSAEEITSLTAICNVLTGKATTTDKLVYINRIEAVFMAVELGALTEAQFNTMLQL